MREYLLRVICAALFCGLVESVPTGSQTAAKLRKLLCGVLVAAVVVSPLIRLDLSAWSIPEDILSEGQAIASQAEEAAREQRNECIRSSVESYILDKAEAMEVELNVTVTVNIDGIPQAVILQGQCPDGIRAELSNLIARELGIPPEAQQWIG